MRNEFLQKNRKVKGGSRGMEGEGGQGDAPLGLPPPLGERGGHTHKYKITRQKMVIIRIFIHLDLCNGLAESVHWKI